MVAATDSLRNEQDYIREASNSKFDNLAPRHVIVGRPQRARNYSTSSLRSANMGPDNVNASMNTSSRQLVTDMTSYGTDPSAETKSQDSDVLQNQKVSPVIKRRWLGLTEIVFNVLGTFGFVVGSLIWVMGVPTPGTLTFAGSCVCCGTSCTIYACKFYGTDDLVGVYALVQQAAGCALFTTCSFLFLFPEYATIALIGFFTASLLFLTGCILTQIQCRSWLGVLAPWCPGTREIIPTSLFNTIGSVFFTIGSIFLFYTWGQQLGAWCYELGSIVFFFASWGDATIWWKLGLTQSEHQQTTLQDDYAAVKFL